MAGMATSTAQQLLHLRANAASAIAVSAKRLRPVWMAPAKQGFFRSNWQFVRYGLVFGLFARFLGPLTLMVSADHAPIFADGQLSSWAKPRGS